MYPLVLYIPENLRWSDEQLLAICELNRHLRIETDTEHNLQIMSPTGFTSGNYNSLLTFLFTAWNRTHRLGYVSDSSTGFLLPDGSVKSPDVAFVLAERIHLLSEAERKGFAPLCPDFVLELRSPSDNASLLFEKMQLYLRNGCRLAWLIDPLDQEVYIFRSHTELEIIPLEAGKHLADEQVLPGFVLHFDELLE